MASALLSCVPHATERSGDGGSPRLRSLRQRYFKNSLWSPSFFSLWLLDISGTPTSYHHSLPSSNLLFLLFSGNLVELVSFLSSGGFPLCLAHDRHLGIRLIPVLCPMLRGSDLMSQSRSQTPSWCCFTGKSKSRGSDMAWGWPWSSLWN